MKDKEKQIEKMAKEMSKELCCYYDKKKRKCINCFGMEEDCDLHCNFGRTLERLSNAGYRKLHEDSVVLSKEEYKSLYNAERASYYRAELLKIENDLLIRKLTDAPKETAKKIYKLVDNNLDLYRNGVIGGTLYDSGYQTAISDIKRKIKDIFKVEIKE